MRTADHMGDVLVSPPPLQDSGPSLHPEQLALGSPWPFCLTKLEVSKYDSCLLPPHPLEESQKLLLSISLLAPGILLF